MKSRLGRMMFDNVMLKVISLALAVTLFYLVRAEKRSLAHGTVSVSFTAGAGRTLDVEPPGELQVSVLGPSSRVQRFRFEDVAQVNIDLAAAREGYFKFREDMLHLPPGFEVASIRPAGFFVRFAHLLTRSLPVKLRLEGQVSPGFRVVSVAATPARIEVHGPRRAVAALSVLETQPLSVENANDRLVALVKLLPLPAGVEADVPLQVSVEVKIAALRSEVTLDDVPVRLADPKRQGWTVEPSRIDVTVVGAAQNLANLSHRRITAEVAAGQGSAGEAVRPRIVGLPAGVVVRKEVPKVVLRPPADR